MKSLISFITVTNRPYTCGWINPFFFFGHGKISVCNLACEQALQLGREASRERTRAWAASPFACGSRVTCRVSPNMESLLVARLSQSPSFLISGSGSWPQREGLLSLSFAFAAENIKILPLALCAREKFQLDLLASLGRSLCAILYLTAAKYPETDHFAVLPSFSK